MLAHHSDFVRTIVGVAALALAAAGCNSAPEPEVLEQVPPHRDSPPFSDGQYEVQTVSYDDATGAYRVFVLNPPAGAKPVYETSSLKMARLSDEDVAAGKKSHIVFGPVAAVSSEASTAASTTGAPEATAADANDGKPTAFLAPDFAIQYTHNVTEERVDAATGQPQVVVVRQETSSWSPFMSAMAGSMIGNMLFAPRYYYPPPYSVGMMSGFGGSGASRALASADYSQKHGSVPQATKLSQSGFKKAPSTSAMKASGSGAGSSRFKAAPSRPSGKSTFGGGFGRRGGGFRRR